MADLPTRIWLFIAIITLGIGHAIWRLRRPSERFVSGPSIDRNLPPPEFLNIGPLTDRGFRGGASRMTWEACGLREGDVGYPAVRAERTAILPNSHFLPQTRADQTKLSGAGLPILETPDDLFKWLDLDLRQAVALANPADRVRPGKGNYAEWTVRKRRGGARIICSPKPRMKAVQGKIKSEILDRAAPHNAAHGFVRGRGIVSNAEAHVARRLVLKIDLRDFFEHVRRPLAVGVFRRMGYSRAVARWLALLCTHRPALGPCIDTPRRGPQVARWSRHTVQGASTSPGIANLCLYRLDCRLTGLAKRFGATYTRYADDLAFSGDESFKRGMKRFLVFCHRIIRSEGFSPNVAKGRFMRSGNRQQITGVVVNEKINCARKDYDRLKAILHNAARAGNLASQNRENRPDFIQHLRGRIAHLTLLNPDRGAKLLAQFNALAG